MTSKSRPNSRKKDNTKHRDSIKCVKFDKLAINLKTKLIY